MTDAQLTYLNKQVKELIVAYRYHQGRLTKHIYKQKMTGNLITALWDWQGKAVAPDLKLSDLTSLIPGIGEGVTFLVDLVEEQEGGYSVSFRGAMDKWLNTYRLLLMNPRVSSLAVVGALRDALDICENFKMDADENGLNHWKNLVTVYSQYL